MSKTKAGAQLCGIILFVFLLFVGAGDIGAGAGQDELIPGPPDCGVGAPSDTSWGGPWTPGNGDGDPNDYDYWIPIWLWMGSWVRIG